MVFLVVMYGCERRTIKKAEHQRIDALELWCWRRLLRAPWAARISNQSILKEISPEYSLEGLMLKLKLQSLGYLIWRTDSFEKTLMLGKTEGGRRRGRQRMRWFNGITMDITQWTGAGDGQGGLACCSTWGHKESDMTERLNWTDIVNLLKKHFEDLPARWICLHIQEVKGQEKFSSNHFFSCKWTKTVQDARKLQPTESRSRTLDALPTGLTHTRL